MPLNLHLLILNHVYGNLTKSMHDKYLRMIELVTFNFLQLGALFRHITINTDKNFLTSEYFLKKWK